MSRELNTDWWLKFLLVVEWYISSGTTIWRLTTWWPCHLAGRLERALTLSAALNIATQVGALPERRGRIIMLVFWIYCKHTGPTDRLSLNKHRSQWKGGRCSAFLSSHNSRLVLQHQPGCGKIQIIIWKHNSWPENTQLIKKIIFLNSWTMIKNGFLNGLRCSLKWSP